jgi:hypothetical protein
VASNSVPGPLPNPPSHRTLHREGWRGEDSNLRRDDPADLQSAPFGRFGTSPSAALRGAGEKMKDDPLPRPRRVLLTAVPSGLRVVLFAGLPRRCGRTHFGSINPRPLRCVTLPLARFRVGHPGALAQGHRSAIASGDGRTRIGSGFRPRSGPRLPTHTPTQTIRRSCAETSSRVEDRHARAPTRSRSRSPGLAVPISAQYQYLYQPDTSTRLAPVPPELSSTGDPFRAPCGSHRSDRHEESRNSVELAMGLEPVTCGLQIRRSTR